MVPYFSGAENNVLFFYNLLSEYQSQHISAPSLSTFRQRLKTFLFQASFPDIITDPPVNYSPPPVDPEVILLLGPL